MSCPQAWGMARQGLQQVPHALMTFLLRPGEAGSHCPRGVAA